MWRAMIRLPAFLPFHHFGFKEPIDHSQNAAIGGNEVLSLTCHEMQLGLRRGEQDTAFLLRRGESED